jgi:release factor glutamine methyltransferase
MDRQLRNYCDALKVVDENPIRLLRWLLEGLGVLKEVSHLQSLSFVSLTQEQKQKVEDGVERLLRKEPLSKILEETEFWGRSFKTTRSTLDPRMDTEVLIEQVLQSVDPKKKYRLLDLGTGTGCIIISLLLELPNATGVAVDISTEALDVARENAEKHNVLDRLSFLQSDWFQHLSAYEKSFDIIVSNPPYIKNDYPLDDSVRLYDPHMALFAGNDGMAAYRRILSDAHSFMTEHGLLFLEIGYDQGESVPAIAKSHGFKVENVVHDQSAHPRVVILSL